MDSSRSTMTEEGQTGKKGEQPKTVVKRPFLIVGVGASAGGLEAFQQLLQNLPLDTGMAFVLVQHLDPTHESALVTILSKATKMRISEIRDEIQIEPNQIYIIAPNTDLSLSDNRFQLVARALTKGQHMPINTFFTSLAAVKGNHAIGVILSGTGSDGALGLQAIKAQDGITFAQDERSAKYAQMPQNAVATGCVDFVLRPEEIAKEILRVSRHAYVNAYDTVASAELGPSVEADFIKVLSLLQKKTGVDFFHYKHTTIRRRMYRRMLLHKKEDIAGYLKFLEAEPSEIQALYNDILINVTEFFRGPETYVALKEIVFPAIMKNRAPDVPTRIWVPGCATGEEVYSIVISLFEFLGDVATNTQVQVFATDISDKAIEKARAGIYPTTSLQNVSPERLRRFFTKVENGFQISKHIRDMCVFAVQNVTADPPFSRLDLISCRNLLIYLGA
ncbi:MAG: hypothetical protein HY537_00620, partial [Deltaproteobacteria bacterium]|nr:hypothetical protein [Deltaproteobacteria bacterium]